MIPIDYSKIQSTTLSSSLNAGDSKTCWREFLLEMQYFINHCSKNVSEDEIAKIISSFLNWTQRSKFQEFKIKSGGKWVKGNVRVGDICYADLGLNYEYECAYAHPILIVEKIRDFWVVVPASTNSDKISKAYNFVDGSGNWQYIKVDASHGFDSECVLMLDNLKTISGGRIVSHKNFINEDISAQDSLFQKVKRLLFENYFERQYKQMEKIILDNDQLICDNDKLISENEELKKQIEEYQKKVSK